MLEQKKQSQIIIGSAKQVAEMMTAIGKKSSGRSSNEIFDKRSSRDKSVPLGSLAAAKLSLANRLQNSCVTGDQQTVGGLSAQSARHSAGAHLWQ